MSPVCYVMLFLASYHGCSRSASVASRDAMCLILRMETNFLLLTNDVNITFLYVLCMPVFCSVSGRSSQLCITSADTLEGCGGEEVNRNVLCNYASSSFSRLLVPGESRSLSRNQSASMLV